MIFYTIFNYHSSIWFFLYDFWLWLLSFGLLSLSFSSQDLGFLLLLFSGLLFLLLFLFFFFLIFFFLVTTFSLLRLIFFFFFSILFKEFFSVWEEICSNNTLEHSWDSHTLFSLIIFQNAAKCSLSCTKSTIEHMNILFLFSLYQN